MFKIISTPIKKRLFSSTGLGSVKRKKFDDKLTTEMDRSVMCFGYALFALLKGKLPDSQFDWKRAEKFQKQYEDHGYDIDNYSHTLISCRNKDGNITLDLLPKFMDSDKPYSRLVVFQANIDQLLISHAFYLKAHNNKYTFCDNLGTKESSKSIKDAFLKAITTVISSHYSADVDSIGIERLHVLNFFDPVRSRISPKYVK